MPICTTASINNSGFHFHPEKSQQAWSEYQPSKTLLIGIVMLSVWVILFATNNFDSSLYILFLQYSLFPSHIR